jgi:ATP-dependent DNA helicase RecQ
MDIHAILEKYWQYSAFRPVQEDIIRSVLAGKDTLALLPTGGGKSICFQVPAMAKEGICIVISPLIALMKDQVENLLSKKIPAAAINSALHPREIELILRDCVHGKIKFLYLSPERLKNELLKNTIQQMNVNLLAVDEAHCISQWGYDFRPPYLDIATFRNLLPTTVPVLALTATATKEVIKDIQFRLNFKEENVFRKSFYRHNLTYFVFKEENKFKRLLQIVSRTQGSGIVYVRSRRKTKEVADFFKRNNIAADFYHAGLTMKEREEKQNHWKTNKIKVIVATNAFGMGIDKSDVRFVVHADIPDSLEAYFQEAGRGGRDEKQAYAILLYEDNDIINLHQNFENSYPPLEVIRDVYQALCNFFQIPVGNGAGASFDFDVYRFTQYYKFKMLVVFNSLTFIERAGFISMTEAANNSSKIHIPLTRDDLYRFQVENEKYDNFIKLLLRSYAGLFSLFVPVEEKRLAANSGIPLNTVIEVLKQLDSKQVIIYQPKTDNPQLTFLQDRVETRHLFLAQQIYDDRKKIEKKRLEETIHYVTSNNKCRSELLLEYFGENQTIRCEKCDVCLQQKREKIRKEEFDLWKNNILLLLQNEDMDTETLIEKLHCPEKKLIPIIRWLLENKIIDKKNDKLTLQWDKHRHE